MNTLYKSPTIACLSISTFIPGINFDLVGEQNTYVDPAASRHSAVGYKISLQRHGDIGLAGAGNKFYRRDAIRISAGIALGVA